jgi:hypothetical protein
LTVAGRFRAENSFISTFIQMCQQITNSFSNGIASLAARRSVIPIQTIVPDQVPLCESMQDQSRKK